MVILFWQKKINLKIHILYKTSTSPWGGGNQFLDYLKSKDIDVSLMITPMRINNAQGVKNKF